MGEQLNREKIYSSTLPHDERLKAASELISQDLWRHDFKAATKDLAVAQKQISPENPDEVSKAVLSNPKFKRAESSYAMDFLSKEFETIHDVSKGGGITTADVKSYVDQCKNSPLAAELAGWLLHSNGSASGQNTDRFNYIAAMDPSGHGEITKLSLALADNRYDNLSQAPEKPRQANDAQLAFLQSHMKAPWLTKAHPQGLTVFALDQIKSDATVPREERNTAAEIEYKFADIQKDMKIDGDQISMTQIAAYKVRIAQEELARAQVIAANQVELNKYWKD